MNVFAVALSDIQRPLAMFAQGLAGRALQLQVSATSDTEALRSGGPDGDIVCVPDTVAAFDNRRHNQGVFRVTVLHRIGYLTEGSFALSLRRLRDLDPSLPPPSASAAGAAAALDRADDLEAFFALWPSPVLMRSLFMTLEDHRIDHGLAARYPGARADLARVLALALQQRPAIEPAAPLAALCELLVRFTLGAPRESLTQQLALQRPHGPAASWPDRLLDRLLDLAQQLQAPGASAADSAMAAASAYRAIIAAGLAPGATDLEPGDTPAELPEIIESPVVVPVGFRGQVPPDVIKAIWSELLDKSDEPGDELPDLDTELPQGSDQAGRRPAFTTRYTPPVQTSLSADGDPDSYLYDEWSYLTGSYLKRWCRIREQRLVGDNPGFIRDAQRRHPVLAHKIGQQFRLIRPESWRRVRRVNDGDDIDLDAQIEQAIDRRRGHAGDDNLYVRREKAMREVAAAFLVDMSASTDFPIPEPEPVEVATEPPPAPVEDEHPYLYGGRPEFADPEPPARRRRVIDVAKDALALMAGALDILGDRYALYGFSGDGREQVEFHVAKDFDDRSSGRVSAGLSAIESRRSTRMGPAIRHAVSRLRHQPVRQKLLIMVSDGYPEDRDYGPDRNDDEYAIQDTARALEEAMRAGVSTFCVTIDPAGHDYLRRMCPDQRYLVIDDVADLPDELSKVYRSLTASG